MDYKSKSTFRKSCLYRKKLFSLLALLTLTTLSIIIFFFYISKIESKINFNDDVIPSEKYQKILSKYYNFSNDNKWYNSENVSQRNKELIREVRENWIIEKPKHTNQNYSLKFPEVKDPSMGQAEVIREIFSNAKNGFFIECGAYDGETRSNTLNLERYFGWTGILIEADPINFAKMTLKNRNAYLSPTCLSITRYPTVSSFLMADNIGRLHEIDDNPELTNSPDIAHKGKHINVQCFPLITYILALNRTSVDYFSLDIEGNEIQVLETIPFHLVDIKTLSVEYIHNTESKKYMIDLMKGNGYYVYSYVEHDNNLANDIIFVKETFIPSAKKKSNFLLNML
ncbi:uncharacterized protein LOC122503701 isoform X2 [Leptopilina heterotoma]|uniref:uncharacterized protein LOC122503701 isoform X2 n=1 Tax=Leptopilina heterotoma TaxID=63436 RepID=UPI001CA88D76|nr:uncharacterized protein LOC122503701 isoform X2 [Leptopilina heterotoma]